MLPVEYPYGGPVSSEGSGPNSPSGALICGLGGLVALDQSSVTGLRKKSKSNSHRTGE